MKGVIVQVGKPKSIVLCNNGKITVIPTVEGAEVGQVVTVKLNNKPKIIAVIVAVVLLVALGVVLGIFLAGKNKSFQQHGQFSQKNHETQIEREHIENQNYENYSFMKGKSEN